MPTYAIGDVQGCLPPLEKLLHKINYQPNKDQLWFTGDLVNRGYHSLEALRFIKSLPNTIVVLGNHDLALLAANRGANKPHPKDTFENILSAKDKEELLQWLQHRPLLHHDSNLGYTLVHAGIYPLWDLNKAQALARELEQCLQGPNSNALLDNLFGNEPRMWSDSLSGWDRLRFITNTFTRMRFCTLNAELDLNAKANPREHPDLVPWFCVKGRQMENQPIIFGHWAALEARCDADSVYPIDSGCVWGNCLTAFCLQTKQIVSVDCKDYIHQPLSLGRNPR
ncbi:MAG: symmetrical bis(5'-nucleosyl)-tetraphosphatase [Candidatus Berkiella sp.]